MSLSSALQIGRSGLLAHQRAIEVTGENLANVNTPGHHRRAVRLEPGRDVALGRDHVLGTGVAFAGAERVLDAALESRLRLAGTDAGGAALTAGLLEQVEGLQNELSGTGLSDRLTRYFDAWSQLSTGPEDPALRSLVVEEARGLAGFLNELRGAYAELEDQSLDQLGASVAEADAVLAEIEDLNGRIATAEGGRGRAREAASLRDRRGVLLTRLAETLPITSTEDASGKLNVHVGSQALMLDGRSRGLTVAEREVAGVDGAPPRVESYVAIEADGTPIESQRGTLGALQNFRTVELRRSIENLDDVAGAIAFETNRAHASSQGLVAQRSWTAIHRVADADLALNLPDADRAFAASHGSFAVFVGDAASGQRTRTTVAVDLDGLGGDDTTLNTLAASLDAVDGLAATVSPDGRLTIAGDTPGSAVSFGEDSSGVLAALGINAFFSGTDATDLAVDAAVVGDPSRLAVGRDHRPGDNRGALAVAALADGGSARLGGRSIRQAWTNEVETLAAATSRARDNASSTATVRESLEAQQQALSGVNSDEEALALLQYQRGYQASARFLSTVDELTQELLRLV
ncbi:flagellar hook-associated protein FlgK [Phycisphaera mikurensis]|uniref:Flagellar hook-associated protein 1 n=1 Tax=Phycisphaera mikurensis (strain NBRC 102666 / KCTC 22515 / FYK2301M01) TaxID=1142394 RepID=I0IAM7_PHYMF|nr:flagellar hook-associated protein FlgK [Phycisphaera mikurensis]MBB6441689.1 flagellar hook-associated protein 1 FlgK [Phycisphaera mikurensis]BAM02315.1 flagellar hook-associated protein [Phycisphaera mikurensis NBRC 102666]